MSKVKISADLRKILLDQKGRQQLSNILEQKSGILHSIETSDGIKYNIIIGEEKDNEYNMGISPSSN